MLAIAGGKGGCGKTTTTLGLAGALGRTRRSVLAVDADLDMPNLHLLAEVDSKPGLTAIANGSSIEDVAHSPSEQTGLSGVKVVPASQSPGKEGQLHSALVRLATGADHVLVDCPAGAGPDAVTPIRAADHVLLVTTPDPACLRDTAKTAAMARALETPVVGCTVARAECAPSHIERLFDCPVLTTIPDTTPPVVSDESAARAYDALASAILSKHL